MKKNEMFVSVDEKSLETVAGGLADLLNYSLNGNTIKLLSDLSLQACVGDILSNILNIANEVG